MTNKKNPQKLLEDIASCEVKNGVPISNGKKIAQLIRLGGKKYSTVIAVMQMCKKSKGVFCTPKHIVDKMWKQWRIEGVKEKGKDEEEEETTLAKVDDKTKEKGKGSGKANDGKSKKKETRLCNHFGKKEHIKDSVGRKILHKCPRNFERRRQKKAGAAVEEEHLRRY